MRPTLSYDVYWNSRTQRFVVTKAGDRLPTKTVRLLAQHVDQSFKLTKELRAAAMRGDK